MKIRIAVCVLALLALPAFAKEKGAKKAPEGGSAEVLKRFDANANGMIDGEEREALRKAFASEEALKSLDTNKNGQIDDEEIEALKGGVKKKKKKDQ